MEEEKGREGESNANKKKKPAEQIDLLHGRLFQNNCSQCF
jgi:hypothetical protein